jgi:predicted nucleotidyltransferase
VRTQADQIKGVLRDILKRHGVKRAALFGSLVRGEATDDSDVDLLVEFGGGKSLLDLVALKLELQDALGRRVDVLTYRALHPLLRERILREQEMVL